MWKVLRLKTVKRSLLVFCSTGRGDSSALPRPLVPLEGNYKLFSPHVSIAIISVRACVRADTEGLAYHDVTIT